MSCKPLRRYVWIWITCLGISIAIGCSPTTPGYLRDTGDLSYYLDQATKIDYPDVDVASLDEVTESEAPITVVDPDFDSFFDLTLEDCLSIALQNSKIYRGYGTPSLQEIRVAPGQDTLANGPQAAGTIYNVAIRETEPGFIGQPGQISSPGSITTNTGLEGNQGVEAALADFDAQITSSVLWGKSDEPRNAVPASPFDPQIFQQDNVQWNFEVAKKTANGTQIFFRQVNTWTENNVPLDGDGGFQVLDSWYRTAFEAEFRQPLLRGRGAFIQRMPIVISRIGTDQELANLEAQLMNLVTNVEIRYWELLCAYRNFDAAKTGRDAALKTWRIVDNRYQEGADVNIQQVAQSRGQYRFFNAQVIQAFNSLLTAESNLRWLMGLAATDGRILRPTDEAVVAPVKFDWYTSKCEALQYRPELRQERWEIKKRELALAYAKNSLLPEFNVTSLYRWLGLGNRYGTSGTGLPFPDVSSGALNELYDGNYQEFQLGGEFRMPVGFRRELTNVRNAQLKLAREIARLEDLELDVTRELHDAMQALATNRRTMHEYYNQWKDTTIEEEHFLELKDAGVETLDVALDAQRRRAQAEQQFYNAVCEYNKIIALIHRRKGTILAFNGICYSEGPWPGKAYMDASEHARRRGASRHINYGWTRPQVISRGTDWPNAHNTGMVGNLSSAEPTLVDPNTIVPEVIEGEVIEQPYYLPEDGTPLEGAPLLTPPVGDTTTSSSRILRDEGVRTVSFEQSVNSAASSPVKTPARSNQGDRPKRDEATAAENIAATRKLTAKATSNRKKTEPVRSGNLNWEKFGLSNPGSAQDDIKAKIKIKED